MTALDIVCLWIGRVWSVVFLLAVLSVLVAAVTGWVHDRRARDDGAPVVPLADLLNRPAPRVVGCGCPSCTGAAHTVLDAHDYGLWEQESGWTG